MIRGPILPQTRDTLWSLMATRLDAIETGLTLVLEGLDCSDGELGVIDGLARDSQGGAVLIILAVDGDTLLSARALSAGQFLQRAGGGLARAVPEAHFAPSVPSRVLVVGGESAAAAIAQVCELPIAGLHACALAPFRIAGQERFAVRWLLAGAASSAPVQVVREPLVAVTPEAPEQDSGLDAAEGKPPFVVPSSRAEVWRSLQSLCSRIDAGVAMHGDRYLRRITWNGSLLGEVRTVGDSLIVRAATGFLCDLRCERDVRRFGDQLLRVFVRRADLNFGCPIGSSDEVDSSSEADGSVSANGSGADEVVGVSEAAVGSDQDVFGQDGARQNGVGNQNGIGHQDGIGQAGSAPAMARTGLARAANGNASHGFATNGLAGNHESTPVSAAANIAASNGRLAAPRHAADERRLAPLDVAPSGESLRSSLAAAKLTQEEYSALGDPSSGAGPSAEGSVAEDLS